MTNRIDNQQIARQLQIRARETQKKQSVEFQQTLETSIQAGAKAKQTNPGDILNRYAAAEEAEKPATTESNESSELGATRAAQTKEEKPQKSQKKQDTQTAHADRQAEKKNDKVALDIAVQRKSQQEQENGESGTGGQGDFFQQAIQIGLNAQSVEQVAAPHNVSLPPGALNEIVDKIYVGVDQTGASQFVIELKSDVLNGGQIQVTAQGKNIKLKLSGLNYASKQTVRAAEGDLKQRLQGKGLTLSSLEL
ncbi:MAG: hypothetical protein V4534_00070 [Myxococcota bacterium]